MLLMKARIAMSAKWGGESDPKTLPESMIIERRTGLKKRNKFK
jgi:hypothetical protein